MAKLGVDRSRPKFSLDSTIQNYKVLPMTRIHELSSREVEQSDDPPTRVINSANREYLDDRVDTAYN